MSVFFRYGNQAWEFKNPELGNEEQHDSGMVFGRSASGRLYRYNKQVTVDSIRLRWTYLTAEKKFELRTIFGALKEVDFVYTDHNNVGHNARFIENSFRPAENWDGYFDVELQLEVY